MYMLFAQVSDDSAGWTRLLSIVIVCVFVSCLHARTRRRQEADAKRITEIQALINAGQVPPETLAKIKAIQEGSP